VAQPSYMSRHGLARLIHEADGAASFQTFLEAEKAKMC
jgi:hypothetical protein